MLGWGGVTSRNRWLWGWVCMCARCGDGMYTRVCVRRCTYLHIYLPPLPPQKNDGPGGVVELPLPLLAVRLLPELLGLVYGCFCIRGLLGLVYGCFCIGGLLGLVYGYFLVGAGSV